MTPNLNFLLKTTLFLIVFSFSLPSNGQVYERDRTDGDSGDPEECPFIVNDGVADSIVINLTLANLQFAENNQSGQNSQNGVTNLPCNLYLGMTNGSTGETQYQSVQSADWGANGYSIDNLYTQPFVFTFTDEELKEACRQNAEIVITLNLYCSENGEFTEYDYCEEGYDEIIPSGAVPQGDCSLALDFIIADRACCDLIGRPRDGGGGGSSGQGQSYEGDDSINFESALYQKANRKQSTDPNLSNTTNFKVFNLNAQMVSSGTILNKQSSIDIVNQNTTLGAGIYIIMYQNDRSTWSEKVIKL